MKQIKLTQQATKRIRKGAYLVQDSDLQTATLAASLNEGEIVQVMDASNQSVGQLLVGRQQKGLGWIYTTQAGQTITEALFAQRIEQALHNRQRLFELAHTTAFRLINGEGDYLGGMTCDWYDGFVQLTWYSAGVYQYRHIVLETLQRQLAERLHGVYEVKRFESATETAIQHVSGEQAPQPLVILENHVKYAVYLGQEWMTGIFLDQREVRQYIKRHIGEHSLLNLFSYTGAFSVAAALGGAQHTVSVDVASRSLAKTQENFMLNQIEAPTALHEIRVSDVFDYVKFALRKQLQFDWVVCDPPSFARTKKYRFSAAQDYAKLAQRLFQLVSVGGHVVFSTNHSGYAKAKFVRDITAVASNQGYQFELIQSFGLPEDYPTTREASSQYLKVLIFRRVQ